MPRRSRRQRWALVVTAVAGTLVGTAAAAQPAEQRPHPTASDLADVHRDDHRVDPHGAAPAPTRHPDGDDRSNPTERADHDDHDGNGNDRPDHGDDHDGNGNGNDNDRPDHGSRPGNGNGNGNDRPDHGGRPDHDRPDHGRPDHDETGEPDDHANAGGQAPERGTDETDVEPTPPGGASPPPTDAPDEVVPPGPGPPTSAGPAPGPRGGVGDTSGPFRGFGGPTPPDPDGRRSRADTPGTAGHRDVALPRADWLFSDGRAVITPPSTTSDTTRAVWVAVLLGLGAGIGLTAGASAVVDRLGRRHPE